MDPTVRGGCIGRRRQLVKAPSCIPRPLELDHALKELLRVANLFDDEGNIKRGLARHSRALAVHRVLSHHRQRVGEQIQRDRDSAFGGPHHRFMDFERVAMLVERRHVRTF